MNRKMLGGLVVGLVAFAYFTFARDYPFRLALLMGSALMILTWAAVRTWDGLRALSQSAPGKGDQRADEKQVDGSSEGDS